MLAHAPITPKPTSAFYDSSECLSLSVSLRPHDVPVVGHDGIVSGVTKEMARKGVLRA